MDTESYEKMKKAIGLLKLLAQGEQDIVEGKVLSQEEFFAAMDRDFDNQNYDESNPLSQLRDSNPWL